MDPVERFEKIEKAYNIKKRYQEAIHDLKRFDTIYALQRFQKKYELLIIAATIQDEEEDHLLDIQKEFNEKLKLKYSIGKWKIWE